MTRILFQAGLTFEAQISSRFLNKGFTLLDQICIGISRHDVTPLRALQLSGLGFSLPRRFPTPDLRIEPLVNKFVWSCLSKRKSSSTASNPLWIHPTGFCGSTIEFTETMIERVPQHLYTIPGLITAPSFHARATHNLFPSQDTFPPYVVPTTKHVNAESSGRSSTLEVSVKSDSGVEATRLLTATTTHDAWIKTSQF